MSSSNPSNLWSLARQQPLPVTNAFIWMTSWVSRPCLVAITSSIPSRSATIASTRLQKSTTTTSIIDLRGLCLAWLAAWPKTPHTMSPNGDLMSLSTPRTVPGFVPFWLRRWDRLLMPKNIFPTPARECKSTHTEGLKMDFFDVAYWMRHAIDLIRFYLLAGSWYCAAHYNFASYLKCKVLATS